MENEAPTRVDRMELFERNVAALRHAVEQYIDRGFCETGIHNTLTLLNPKIVADLCFNTGKPLGRPWVYIERRTDCAWLSMPNKAALKHLRTPILMIGTGVKNATYSGPAVQYVDGNPTFKAFFTKQGMNFLEEWKELVSNDRACRMAMCLPPR